MRIPQNMIDFLALNIDSGVHLSEDAQRGASPSSAAKLYALDLAERMYHVEINLTIYKHPTVFAINDKQCAAMVDNEENLALAVATACALTYGWLDPDLDVTV